MASVDTTMKKVVIFCIFVVTSLYASLDIKNSVVKVST